MLVDHLSIVIPNKNEGKNLTECLRILNSQAQIRGVRVIIADNSSIEQKPNYADLEEYDNLSISIVEGGYPACARRNGSILVDTPYLLFLDADMKITDWWLLYDIINQYYGQFDLLTIPFRTDPKWDWGYRIFDLMQWFSHKILRQPLAIGGFQLFRTYAYWETGGYDCEQLFAEDYSISIKIKAKNFKVYRIRKGIWTSPRRFENKGIWYMVRLMVMVYLNRNNPEFFKKSHGYWD